MGFLDGGLAPLVFNAFEWILLDGFLYKRVLEDDGKGGITVTDLEPVAIKGMVDPATQIMRQAEGFREDDVSILMLAYQLPPPRLDDRIFIRDTLHHILPPIMLDPAMTHYVFRGRAV
jgi:hypothetical protein